MSAKFFLRTRYRSSETIHACATPPGGSGRARVDSGLEPALTFLRGPVGMIRRRPPLSQDHPIRYAGWDPLARLLCASKGHSMGLRTCVSSRSPDTEENNESDTEHSGGQRLRIGRARGARAGGDGHVTHALRMRHAPGARRRQPALFGYLRLWR